MGLRDELNCEDVGVRQTTTLTYWHVREFSERRGVLPGEGQIGVETEAELKALHNRLARGTPLGDTLWRTKTTDFGDLC